MLIRAVEVVGERIAWRVIDNARQCTGPVCCGLPAPFGGRAEEEGQQVGFVSDADRARFVVFLALACYGGVFERLVNSDPESRGASRRAVLVVGVVLGFAAGAAVRGVGG